MYIKFPDAYMTSLNRRRLMEFFTEGILEEALFLAAQMNIERNAFVRGKHTQRESLN